MFDLTASEIALRRGLDNTPNEEQKANLALLEASLERIQAIIGPLHINSAFRSPKVNFAVGGSASSAHLEGYAADFTCPSFGTPLEICKRLEIANIPFDQLIQEGTWVHWSIDPRSRGIVLTAHFQNGKVSYTSGIEVRNAPVQA